MSIRLKFKEEPVTTGAFIMCLLHGVTNAHILHLQSQSYAQHKALGSFYEDECETDPLDVSTYSFKLQAKNTSGTVMIEWLNADFVQIDSHTRKVTLTPVTTATYTAGEYTYELEVTISTNKYTWMQGYVEVQNQVTS